MDGAVVIILKNPASKKSKDEILKAWTRSLVAAGFAGRQLIVKLELGTDELDMSVIQGAYKKSLAELAEQGIDISPQSEIFATSRRLKDGGWPQREWKLTAQGAKRSLGTLLYLLNKYNRDLSGFNLKEREKTGVIIHGAGFIGLTMAEVLSLDRNYILRGIADAEAAIYNYEGLDVNILNKLAKENKPVKDYLGYKEARLLSPEELLQQEAGILITASIIATDDWRLVPLKEDDTEEASSAVRNGEVPLALPAHKMPERAPYALFARREEASRYPRKAFFTFEDLSKISVKGLIASTFSSENLKIEYIPSRNEIRLKVFGPDKERTDRFLDRLQILISLTESEAIREV